MIRTMVLDLERRIKELEERVHDCQRRTGYYNFDDTFNNELPAFEEKDLDQLTKNILGTASLLARYVKTLQRLLECAQLVISENKRFSRLPGKNKAPIATRLERYIRESAQFEISRIKTLQGPVRENQETASALIPGVLSIITHRDLDESRKVAEASKREGTSMSTIAFCNDIFSSGNFHCGGLIAAPFLVV